VWLGVKHNGWGALAWADKVACAKWLRVGGIRAAFGFKCSRGNRYPWLIGHSMRALID